MYTLNSVERHAVAIIYEPLNEKRDMVSPKESLLALNKQEMGV